MSFSALAFHWENSPSTLENASTQPLALSSHLQSMLPSPTQQKKVDIIFY